ncbi:hypothetical protein K435DRAFT_875365 [Dendrothele bispora CBS 962.96]|uniref:Uncharacterized protein n=1 Tax=Dendrothele bispora (strain CBS 962.96) TaxID=1314807 RepID=A0A4S8KUX2_DENBC|nr:hypothetical protein K435DRAFT_875365 [Dendrothele bispora CBS 962.96]
MKTAISETWKAVSRSPNPNLKSDPSMLPTLAFNIKPGQIEANIGIVPIMETSMTSVAADSIVIDAINHATMEEGHGLLASDTPTTTVTNVDVPGALSGTPTVISAEPPASGTPETTVISAEPPASGTSEATVTNEQDNEALRTVSPSTRTNVIVAQSVQMLHGSSHSEFNNSQFNNTGRDKTTIVYNIRVNGNATINYISVNWCGYKWQSTFGISFCSVVTSRKEIRWIERQVRHYDSAAKVIAKGADYRLIAMCPSSESHPQASRFQTRRRFVFSYLAKKNEVELNMKTAIAETWKAVSPNPNLKSDPSMSPTLAFNIQPGQIEANIGIVPIMEIPITSVTADSTVIDTIDHATMEEEDHGPLANDIPTRIVTDVDVPGPLGGASTTTTVIRAGPSEPPASDTSEATATNEPDAEVLRTVSPSACTNVIVAQSVQMLHGSSHSEFNNGQFNNAGRDNLNKTTINYHVHGNANIYCSSTDSVARHISATGSTKIVLQDNMPSQLEHVSDQYTETGSILATSTAGKSL